MIKRSLVEQWREQKQRKKMARHKRREAKAAREQQAKVAEQNAEMAQHGPSAVLMNRAVQFARTMRRLVPQPKTEAKPPRYTGPFAGARQIARQQRQAERDRAREAARNAAAVEQEFNQ